MVSLLRIDLKLRHARSLEHTVLIVSCGGECGCAELTTEMRLARSGGEWVGKFLLDGMEGVPDGGWKVFKEER